MLAITGGIPVRKKGWPSWPISTESDREAVAGKRKNGENFETRFAHMCGTKHCVVVANGTVSLELILRALGIGRGDEVILPPYTFIATFSSIVFTGAKPVFADIEAGSYNISAADAERRLTPASRAIIAVAVGGRPADLDALSELAQRRGIYLIIDAAQAVGAEWRGRSISSYGVAASISCQNTKNLTCGEGGIITTDSDELDAVLRSSFGGGKDGGGRIITISQGHALSAIQTAVLDSQLDKLPRELELRSNNAAYLDGRLKTLPFVSAAVYDPRITRNAYHLYIMRFNGDILRERGITRKMFISALSAEGIPLSPGYAPLYDSPAVSSDYIRRVVGGKVDITPLPECEKASKLEGAWFSQSMLLGDHNDMDDIADALEKIWSASDELRKHCGGSK